MSAVNVIKSMYSSFRNTDIYLYIYWLTLFLPHSALINTTERRKHPNSATCAYRWHWSKSSSCFTHELICLFSPSFFITETAVNYWLTGVLITMQIWGKMKSKAAGSCHIPLQKHYDWKEGCYRLDLCCQTALRWKERKCNLGYCFVHLMTISIKGLFYDRHKIECDARKDCIQYYMLLTLQWNDWFCYHFI